MSNGAYIYGQSGHKLAQMLPVPGSRVKYFRGKILQMLRVLAVFGPFVLCDTAILSQQYF